MDTKNGTGGIARNISATLQSLQTENEQLRAGYDAARQEIASLRAQPYDQQAMGLCQVCGWKGVIDYPDGAVCVACEHDKTLSPQPTAQAQAMPAPGVEAVSEREFKQFMSAVLTAAGLVTHGKKCKDLGRRLGEMSMRLLTAPKTAAAPGQALDAARVFWQQHTQADALSMTMTELHADVELVIRAARGAAQAAPGRMEPVAWLHDCAALLTNDVELWIDACPHCGKPRNAPQHVERQPLTDEQIEAAQGIAAKKGDAA